MRMIRFVVCVVGATQRTMEMQFIKAFPDAYATDVGTGGLQLSGGQKQVSHTVRATFYFYFYFFYYVSFP